jgi:hypothetical protein
MKQYLKVPLFCLLLAAISLPLALLLTAMGAPQILIWPVFWVTAALLGYHYVPHGGWFTEKDQGESKQR